MVRSNQISMLAESKKIIDAIAFFEEMSESKAFSSADSFFEDLNTTLSPEIFEESFETIRQESEKNIRHDKRISLEEKLLQEIYIYSKPISEVSESFEALDIPQKSSVTDQIIGQINKEISIRQKNKKINRAYEINKAYIASMYFYELYNQVDDYVILKRKKIQKMMTIAKLYLSSYINDLLRIKDISPETHIKEYTRVERQLNDRYIYFQRYLREAPTYQAFKENVERIKFFNMSYLSSSFFKKSFYPFTYACHKIQEFLSMARKESKLMRYIDGDENGKVKTKTGIEVQALGPEIEEIAIEPGTEQEKLFKMEQAVLNMYFQIRKDQGWFDSCLANALEHFLISPEGLNLFYKYGPSCVIPHAVKADNNTPNLSQIKHKQDHLGHQVIDYFESQDKFDVYMKKNNLSLKHINEKINLDQLDDVEKARVRIIVKDLARQLNNSSNDAEHKKSDALFSLLNEAEMLQDKKNHQFVVAFQRLKIQLNPILTSKNENFLNKHTIETLISDLESIHMMKVSTDEKVEYMKRHLIEAYSDSKPKTIISLFFGENKLANTLEKFCYQELNMSKKEIETYILNYKQDNLEVEKNVELVFSNKKNVS